MASVRPSEVPRVLDVPEKRVKTDRPGTVGAPFLWLKFLS